MSAPERRILLGIVALAVASRAAYLVAFRGDVFAEIPIHDARMYFDQASTWASGGASDAGAFHQAPLYPGILSLLFRATGPALVAAFAMQAILGIAVVLLVARIAARAYGMSAGIAAALLATFYGTFPFFETKLLPAMLAVALVALLVERMQAADAGSTDVPWAIPGVVLGLAGLTNPGFLVLAPLAVGWIVLEHARSARSRASRTLAFVLAVVAVVLPVTVRNRVASGEWVLVSTNGGITFYQGNNANAVGVFAAPDGFTGRIATQRQESKARAEAESGRTLSDAQVSSFWFRKGLDFLASDPAHAAALVGRKLLLALASEEQPLEYNLRLDDNPARFLAPLPFGIVLALAALRPGRRRSVVDRRAEAPVLLLLLTQLVLLLAFFVSARYRLPAMPALLAIGGFGVVALWNGRRSPWTWTIVALVAVASLAYVPVAQSSLSRHQLAMSWSDRGAALRIAKRLDGSVAAYRRSIELEPKNPLGHLDLAKTLQASGRAADAEASVGEALRLAPGLAEAWLDLGVMAFKQDRLEQAERAFAEAHRLAPTEPQAANNLLGTRLRLGRRAEALETYRELTALGVAIDPRLEAWIRDLQ